MSEPRVLFRTEVSTEAGFGHLSRSAALAQALDAEGWQIVWLLDRAAEVLCGGFDLPGQCCWIQNLDAESLAALEGADCIIFDGYGLTVAEIESLGRLARFRVRFDDAQMTEPCSLDWVIDPLADRHDIERYHALGVTEVTRGLNFLCLRAQESEPPLDCSMDSALFQQQGALLISFGGADALDLAGQLVEWWIECPLAMQIWPAEMPVHLMIGRAYSYLPTLRKRVAHLVRHHPDLVHRFKLDVGSSQLLRRIGLARAGMVCAGTTAFEFASQCVPALRLVVSHNQERCARMLKVLDGGQPIDVRDGPDWPRIWESACDLWRENRAGTGRAPVDGQGARRLAQLMTASLTEPEAHV